MEKLKENITLGDSKTLGSGIHSRQFDAFEQDLQKGAMTISQLLADKGVQGGVTLNNDFETGALSFLATEKAMKYKVGEILARGGMGVVLDAKDLNCRRKVAMKVINEEQQGSTDQILRFIVEAQICAQLEHPGIVPVYELSVDATSAVFYTMKLVKGETLVDILIEIKNGNQEYIKKYPLMRLLNIYLRVCDAIAFAHSKNVVHRDLKPENVMVGDYGEVLVMDWGLAKILDNENSVQLSESQTLSHDLIPSTEYGNVDSILTDGPLGDSMKTMHGQIMGTPGFMPPEQALGKVEDIDIRSDIYALGGILYNILALQPPITGLTIKQVIRKIVRGDITKPSAMNEEQEFPHCPYNKIPEPLSAISMKALSSHPADRYRKVADLQNDIEKYLGGFATSVENAGFVKLVLLLVKRNRRKVISGVVGLVLLITIVAGFMVKLVEAKNSAEENLHKFLHEHTVRKEVSRKLLLTAIEEIKKTHSENENLTYRYSLLDNNFSLNMEGNNKLKDLNPIQHLPLTHLNLNHTSIENLQALVGMPLQWLSIAGTNVSELTPIKKAPLIHLNIANTKISSLKPLLKTELSSLNLAGTRIGNLIELKKLPLTHLVIDSKQLRKINFLKDFNLNHLGLNDAVAEDLYSLRKLNISSLEIMGRQFNNLDVLKGMELQHLSLIETTVKSIRALSEMKLNSLKISGSALESVEGIQKLPLKELVLEKCYHLKDISPVFKCLKLEKLLIPTHLSNIKKLRNLKNLKVLATNAQDYEDNRSVTEFWEEFDRNAKLK